MKSSLRPRRFDGGSDVPKKQPSDYVDPIRSETLRKSPSPLVNGEVNGSTWHSEEVLANRERRFRAMGFTEFVADFLASSRIDLHMMEDLLSKGCPHHLACQILVGTMWSGEDDHWPWMGEMDYLEERENDDRELTSESALG